MTKLYKLINTSGEEWLSEKKGTLGGHRKLKIYGRLDCPSASRYLAKGQYAQHRVFLLMNRLQYQRDTDRAVCV